MAIVEKTIIGRGPGTCFFNQPQTPMGRIIKESHIPKGIWWRGESNCEKVITIKSGGSLCANRYCFSQIKTMTTGNPRIRVVYICRGIEVTLSTYYLVRKCLFMMQQRYAISAQCTIVSQCNKWKVAWIFHKCYDEILGNLSQTKYFKL